mmetsp:Transcript_455/g.1221  ORF Transcript_455/g.1221 Transcript_455/m.1221 type:complete len:255 (-) Transcript_455:2284-3048(-)
MALRLQSDLGRSAYPRRTRQQGPLLQLVGVKLGHPLLDERVARVDGECIEVLRLQPGVDEDVVLVPLVLENKGLVAERRVAAVRCLGQEALGLPLQRPPGVLGAFAELCLKERARVPGVQAELLGDPLLTIHTAAAKSHAAADGLELLLQQPRHSVLRVLPDAYLRAWQSAAGHGLALDALADLREDRPVFPLQAHGDDGDHAEDPLRGVQQKVAIAGRDLVAQLLHAVLLEHAARPLVPALEDPDGGGGHEDA